MLQYGSSVYKIPIDVISPSIDQSKVLMPTRIWCFPPLFALAQYGTKCRSTASLPLTSSSNPLDSREGRSSWCEMTSPPFLSVIPT